MATQLTLTTVVGPVETPTGDKPVNGRVTFRLPQVEGQLQTVIGPIAHQVLLDVEGEFTTQLWATTTGAKGLSYAVSLTWFDTLSGQLMEAPLGFMALAFSASTQNLKTLLVPQMPAVVPTDILAAAAAYASAASADRIAAQAARDLAATSATAAATSASNAALYDGPAIPNYPALQSVTSGQVPVGGNVWNRQTGTIYERVASGGMVGPTSPGNLRFIAVAVNDEINVRAIGAVADGTSDLTPFVTAIHAAGKIAVVDTPGGAGFWRMNTKLVMAPDTALVMSRRRAPEIRKGANIDLIDMQSGAVIQGGYFNLNGATNTGLGISIPSGQNRQILIDTMIWNAATSCLFFKADGGSQFMASGVLDVYSQNNPAVVIEDVLTVTGMPRYIEHIQTNGGGSVSLGGANGIYIGGFMGAPIWSNNSLNVDLNPSRIFSGAAPNVMQVRGAAHRINTNSGPQIELLGTDIVVMGQGNNPPIIDRGQRNLAWHHPITFSCYLSSETSALATATINGSGGVASVAMNFVGSGYTSAPSVLLVGGGGTGATATAVFSAGTVTAVNVTAAGTGYRYPPLVVFVGGGGANIGNGSITAAAARAGNTIKISGQLIVGSTTVFGGGRIQLSLPEWISNQYDLIQATGITWINQGAGATVGGYVQSLAKHYQMFATATSPLTIAAGTVLYFGFEYEIGSRA